MALTDQQRQFIERYLKDGFFNRRSNAKKVARYETYLAVKADIERIITSLAGVTPNIGPVQTLLGQAERKATAGAFADAVAEAEQALEMARFVESEIARRRQERMDLAAQLGALASDPDGALADEVTELAEKRRVASNLIADDVPSVDAVASFGPALEDLRQALETVRQAAALRATQKKTLADGHAENAARMQTVRALLARATTDAQHGALDGTATQIETDLGTMAAVAGGTDPVAIAAKLTDLAAMPGRIDTLAAGVDAALSRVLTATLGNTGTSDAQKEKLVALGKADPAALAAATTVLEGIKADLGDTVVDRALVDTRGKARDDADREVAEKKKDLRTAKQALSEAVEDEKAKLAALKEAFSDGQAKWIELSGFHKTNKAALEDDTHPNHAILTKQLATLKQDYEAYFKAHGKAKAAHSAATDAVKDCDADVVLAEQAFATAETDLAARKKEFDQAQGKKLLLEAISFGPLSPDNGTPVPADVAPDLIALYGRNPRVADTAVTEARRANNPESVAATAALVCDKVESKFAHGQTRFSLDSYCETYAQNLVKMSGALTPTDAAKLGDYLDAGRHFQAVDGVVAERSLGKTGVKRTKFVGDAMLKDDGTLDFAKGRDAVLDVMFHPEAQDRPTPGQALHMLDTMDFLEGSGAARDILTDATAPTSDAAKGLVAKSSGKAENACGEKETRTAILNAMLTPVFQGNVGSCFATAGVVKLRSDDPLEAMKTYREIAQDGVYTPKAGDPVPAMTGVAEGNDPLVRSLEYSAATAIARADFSDMNAGVDASVSAMIDVVLPGVKKKARGDVTARLENAIKGAIEIVYDPEIEIPGKSADESSTKGCYRMKNTRDDTFITDIEQYRDLIFDLVKEEVTKKDTTFRTSVADVGNLVNDASFVNAAKVNGELPWKLSSGGKTEEASRTIFGGDISLNEAVPRAPAGPVDVGKRCEAILSSVLTDFAPSTDPPNPKEMSTVKVTGIHGFNMMSGDGALDPLREGGPDKIADNIDRLLTKPADDLAKAPVPVEKLAYMFEQEMLKLGKNAKGPAKTALDDILANEAPTVPMTPAEFKTYLEDKSAAYITAKVDADAAAWVTRQTPAPDQDVIDARKAKKTKRLERSRDNSVGQTLIEDLGAPQFVFADTNWGNAGDHTYFVMIGDPVTGTTMLYKKTDPTGRITPLKDTEKWVKTKWQKVA